MDNEEEQWVQNGDRELSQPRTVASSPPRQEWPTRPWQSPPPWRSEPGLDNTGIKKEVHETILAIERGGMLTSADATRLSETVISRVLTLPPSSRTVECVHETIRKELTNPRGASRVRAREDTPALDEESVRLEVEETARRMSTHSLGMRFTQTVMTRVAAVTPSSRTIEYVDETVRREIAKSKKE